MLKLFVVCSPEKYPLYPLIEAMVIAAVDELEARSLAAVRGYPDDESVWHDAKCIEIGVAAPEIRRGEVLVSYAPSYDE